MLQEYIHVVRRDMNHYFDFSKLYGVIMYTLALSLPEVMLPYPLVLYTPHRKEIGLDKIFEIILISQLRIPSEPQGFCMTFPLG